MNTEQDGTMQYDKEQLERVCRECFWDYPVSTEDLERIFTVGSYQEKKKLFFKIIYNSTDRLRDLRLFTQKELEQLFQEPLPEHKSKYIQRQVDIVKSLLLGVHIPVKGLEWKIK